MNATVKFMRGVPAWRSLATAKFAGLPRLQQSALIWSVAIMICVGVSIAMPEAAYAQNLESFASKVRALLSSTLLRTLAVIAVIVTGLLWFTGRASTAVLVTVIIGMAIVFSADSIVGLIAG
jgi:type IV secretion system protein VirB2